MCSVGQQDYLCTTEFSEQQSFRWGLLPEAVGAGVAHSSLSGGKGSLWGGGREDLWFHSQQRNHRPEHIKVQIKHGLKVFGQI